MNNPNPHETVIFRMPGSDRVEFLEHDEGKDQFILAPFLKSESRRILKGTIHFADEIKTREIFESWDAAAPADKVSVKQMEYADLVTKALIKIDAGDFKKVVLAGKKWFRSKTKPGDLFRCLCLNNTNAFVYACNMNGNIMFGASPEMLLGHKGGLLKTEALGGTSTSSLFHEKEWKEHAQIQDYIKQVLEDHHYGFTMQKTKARIAGSVEHLCTGFEMIPKSLQNDLDLAEKLHPTSAVCGLPYAASLRFIIENEGLKRGYYSGFLGPIRNEKEFQFYVNLRCATWYNTGLFLYAGAGINSMSVPKQEWKEINYKMQTIAQCLK